MFFQTSSILQYLFIGFVFLVSTAFFNGERENAATKGLVNYCDDYECELPGSHRNLPWKEAELAGV